MREHHAPPVAALPCPNLKAQGLIGPGGQCKGIVFPLGKGFLFQLDRDLLVRAGKHLLGKPKGKHIFGTAKVGEKGQIVIPKEARTLFGVQPGDTLLILGDEQMGIIVTKPEVIENAAMKIFEEMEREPK